MSTLFPLPVAAANGGTDGLGFLPDEISEWSERKIRIIEKYAHVYAKILLEKGLTPFYIDGWCGGGTHVRRGSMDQVPGAAAAVLKGEPPFAGYHLIDLDTRKCAAIEKLGANRANVHVYPGDANDLLPAKVFPLVRRARKERGLCFIDPYKLDVSWTVLEAAGKNQALEGFLLFPTSDIRRNILRSDRKISKTSEARMTRFWGDDGWKKIIYRKATGLLHDLDQVASIGALVAEFCRRLVDVAGFQFTSKPLSMRNKTNAEIYQLLFATHHPLALSIATSILKKESAPLKRSIMKE